MTDHQVLTEDEIAPIFLRELSQATRPPMQVTRAAIRRLDHGGGWYPCGLEAADVAPARLEAAVAKVAERLNQRYTLGHADG